MTHAESPLGDAPDSPTYCHILIRSDIPPEAQMAQCAHAAQEALRLHPNPPSGIHVAILSCPDEDSLLLAARRLEIEGISHALFFEPDWPRGHTALGCAPQRKSSGLRRALGRFPLWRSGASASR